MIIGISFTYYGWKDYITDGVMEEYDATKWFCLAWLPIIPIASYRVRRKCPKDIISRLAREILSSQEIEIIYKRTLDFGQILRVYFIAYVSFLMIVKILEKIQR